MAYGEFGVNALFSLANPASPALNIQPPPAFSSFIAITEATVNSSTLTEVATISAPLNIGVAFATLSSDNSHVTIPPGYYQIVLSVELYCNNNSSITFAQEINNLEVHLTYGPSGEDYWPYSIPSQNMTGTTAQLYSSYTFVFDMLFTASQQIGVTLVAEAIPGHIINWALTPNTVIRINQILETTVLSVDGAPEDSTRLPALIRMVNGVPSRKYTPKLIAPVVAKSPALRRLVFEEDDIEDTAELTERLGLDRSKRSATSSPLRYRGTDDTSQSSSKSR
jgi:hypothetical protein